MSNVSNNIKTSLDQKSCQILNKTSAVLDKVKITQNELSKQNTATETRQSESDILVNGKQDVSSQNSLHSRSGKGAATPSNVHAKQKQKEHITNNQNQQQKKNPTANKTNISLTEDTETVDLTKTTRPKKSIKHATLLTGDSILRKVRTSELNANTTVRSFPGATINTLKSYLSGYDLDECKTVLIHVGTNDAADDADIETFAENFESLITD